MDVTRIVSGLGWVAVSVILIRAEVTSQAVVLPPSHTAIAGTGSTNVPFGRSTATRAQFIYDASLFGGVSTTFQTVDFRIEEGQTVAGKGVELEIHASSLGRSVIGTQATFAANRGVDDAVVFARQVFQLPSAGTSSSPNALDVSIPLDQSFTFDPAVGGALVLELIVFGQAPGAFPLDTTFVCVSPQRSFGPTGCGPSGGPVLQADSVTSQVTWGGNVTLRVYDADPSAVAAFMFGFQETGRWRGLDLPFDLGLIGAGGCSLSIGVATTISTTADATGTALYSLFLPSQIEIIGEWIKFQGVAFSPAANPLGVITSQGYAIQVCGWEPTARVFASGTAATAGLREIGVAPVIQLR